jgi:hypothetical protein
MLAQTNSEGEERSTMLRRRASKGNGRRRSTTHNQRITKSEFKSFRSVETGEWKVGNYTGEIWPQLVLKFGASNLGI